MRKGLERKLTIVISSLIVIGLLNLLPISSIGKEVNEFDNGGGTETEWSVILAGESGFSSDSTTSFSVPIHKGKIQEASVKITCLPDQFGETLLNPRLDIGIDGDYEWEFTGKGYGSINHQTKFSTDMNRRIVAIGGLQTTNSTKLYLPKNAVIDSALMEIQGGNLEFGEIYIAAVTDTTEVYYIKSKGNRNFGNSELVSTLGTTSGWPRSYSYGVGVGDFDNDGDNDIVANEGLSSWPTSTGNIYLLKKTGANNSFAAKKKVGTTNNYRNSDFAVADFNNDGRMDFITSEMNSNIYYFKNIGSLNFNKTVWTSSFGGGTAYGKDVADFNLDGNMDVVIGGSGSGSVYIMETNNDGSLKSEKKISLNTGSNSRMVAAGDYNTDGNPDIVAKDTQTWPPPAKLFQFAQGNGDLTFLDSIDITNIDINGWNFWDMYAIDGFDFDFDGNQDLVTYNYSWAGSGKTQIRVHWGNGKGGFNGYKIINVPGRVSGVATPPSEVLGGCDNLRVDIGDTGGTADFSFTGPFTTNKEIEFRNQLTNILASPPPELNTFTDEYGNTLIEIPIRFTADEIGNVLLKNMSIRYQYAAKVDKNPHNTNLVNELNDLIPKSGKGQYKVYFSIASDNPGQVKFSNLNIKFNEAPTLNNDIPDMSIIEGTDVWGNNFIDLAEYFSDDEEDPKDLVYSIYSQTNSDNVIVTTHNGHYLRVDATYSPDWFGATHIIVEAEDSGNGITRSNKFTVTINPYDDEPRIGRFLTNIELKTNEVYKKIDLDDPNEYYFYDVDSPTMYFRGIINSEIPGELDGYLEISIDNDTAVLRLKSFNNYKKRIPVRIYCSDTKDVRTMELKDLAKVPTFQDFLVNITEFGMGKKPTFPPVWSDIKDVEIPEDDTLINWINLNNYTTDQDGSTKDIVFSIESLTNSAFLSVFISTSKSREFNHLSIIPETDFDGQAEIVLRAEDADHNHALETFKVNMIPEPDMPEVEILSPVNNSIVTGSVVISGRAEDAEGNLDSVEIKIGNDQWITAEGTTFWSYTWNSIDLIKSTGGITVKARAIDIDERYSEIDTIQLQIDNVVLDSDNDGVPDDYDAFPNDPINWEDSDGDGVGDNSDAFPDEPTQWEDADGDGYGDNPDGEAPDAFRLDITQWIDADGDGYGDNPLGNNPDLYPNNKNRHSEAGGSDDEGLLSAKNMIWLAIIPFVIIDILIFMFIRLRKKKLQDKKKDEE
jgi:hypothetical protein